MKFEKLKFNFFKNYRKCGVLKFFLKYFRIHTLIKNLFVKNINFLSTLKNTSIYIKKCEKFFKKKIIYKNTT